jgi:hypothetical protein
MPGLVPGIHVLPRLRKTWMAGTSPAMTATCYLNKRHRSRDGTPIRVLRQANKNGTKREPSSDQGAKPAVESGFFVAIETRESQEKKRKKKEGRKAKRRQTRTQRPAHRRGRAPAGALAYRRSTTALAVANERHSSTPATRFL